MAIILSEVYVFALGKVSVTNGFQTVTGNGFVFEWAEKSFFNKESWKGFYTQSGIEGGTINFSASNYSGSYKYFSFFNSPR